MGQKTTFAMEPFAKPRLTRRDKWWQTSRTARPIVINYYKNKTELNILAKKMGYKVGDTLDIIFYITMPASWSGKKRILMRGKPHQQKPDIDNLIKGFTDALCEADEHIYRIQASKYWDEKGKIYVYETT